MTNIGWLSIKNRKVNFQLKLKPKLINKHSENKTVGIIFSEFTSITKIRRANTKNENQVKKVTAQEFIIQVYYHELVEWIG